MFFGANVKGVGFRGPVLPPKTMVWLVICRVRGQDVSVKILRWYNFQGTITYPTVQGSQPEHHRLKWVPAIGGNIYVIVHWRGPLGPSKRLFRRNRSPGISKIHRSGQIIATVSRPFQNVVEECAPNNALNSGLGIIVIRSDRWILPSLCFRNSFLKVSCRPNSRKSGSVEECSYHEIWRKVSLKVSLLNNWNLNYSTQSLKNKNPAAKFVFVEGSIYGIHLRAKKNSYPKHIGSHKIWPFDFFFESYQRFMGLLPLLVTSDHEA